MDGDDSDVEEESFSSPGEGDVEVLIDIVEVDVVVSGSFNVLVIGGVSFIIDNIIGGQEEVVNVVVEEVASAVTVCIDSGLLLKSQGSSSTLGTDEIWVKVVTRSSCSSSSRGNIGRGAPTRVKKAIFSLEKRIIKLEYIHTPVV